jgi:spermidine synthase
MQRYGGTLVHRCRDEYGVLEIVETHGIRSLHFGTSPRQSALDLDDPNRLELPYVRAMLSALAFLPEPGRVLILGLGGGSLARFLLREFPQCRVDAVELRPQVVELAQNYFSLPKDPRLTVHLGDATAYVHSPPHNFRYDLILVDAYDHVGMDPNINAADFFASCSRLLAAEGVLAMNLWGTHKIALRDSTELLKRYFEHRSFLLPVPNRGNIVGLGLNDALTSAGWIRFKERARELEIRLGIEFPYLLRRIKPL